MSPTDYQPKPYTGQLNFLPELADFDSVQFATVYVEERPVATLARRQYLQKGPIWTLYATDGTKLREFWLRPLSYEHLARATEKVLQQRGLVRTAERG